MTMDKDSDIDQAWQNRVLCSDESCIGVIGPDGRCKECGLEYQGELPLPKSTEPADSDSSEKETEILEAETEAEGDADRDDEWSQRKLCTDESCIGVIGTDGRCKECGRPYES